MTFFKAGFSFEAGGRAYCPVVSQSMSGTLPPMFGSFTFTVHFHSVFYFLKTTWVSSSPAWETLETAFLSVFSILRISWGECPQNPLGACSALAKRLVAPRQISRPVLSQPCPLLYKAIENPVKVRKQSKCWNNHLLFYIICSCWLCENIEFLERTEFNVSCAKGWFNWPLIHETKWEVEPLLSLVKTLSTRGWDGRNLGSSQVLAFAWCDLSYYL